MDRTLEALVPPKDRRQAGFEKANSHATPVADFWDTPADANVFPMK